MWLEARLLLYLNVKKNEISEALLTSVNSELKGDFTVNSISLGSLWNYPNLQVSVHGLKFHAPSGPITHGEVILDVETIHLKTDLTDVLSKKIHVEYVYIKNANLFIERDSLENMVISEGFQQMNPVATVQDSADLSIDIDEILINDSKVLILDQATGMELPFNLRQCQRNFSYEK